MDGSAHRWIVISDESILQNQVVKICEEDTLNKTRKIQLLYQKAHGKQFDASPKELQELKKYRISKDDIKYATKRNITDYVDAVDNGSCHLPFLDWCWNNYRADKRRKGSSEEEMANTNTWDGIASVALGWLIWGVAFYWMFQERVPANACGVLGAVVSIIITRVNRRRGIFLLFGLPIILSTIFGWLL